MFKGKTAIVIGATSEGGIGEGVARDLAARGAKVYVAGRRLANADALASQIGGTAVECDVTNETDLATLMATPGEAGRPTLDIVVNAAGRAFASRVDQIEKDMLVESTLVNLVGPVLAIKWASRHLVDGGVFLQVTSIAASQPTPMSAPYSICKSALEQALRIAAIEGGPRAIRFLGIAPGVVLTPMTEFLDNQVARDAVTSITPLRRMVAVDDVVAMARFLVSGECFETGSVFPVTGGAIRTRALGAEELFPVDSAEADRVSPLAMDREA